MQSEFAQRLLREKLPSAYREINTIYLFADDQVFQKSAAVFKVITPFMELKWIYLFSFLPSIITDFFYDLIAKNRYLWFGRQEKCKMPSPELAERFWINSYLQICNKF